MPDQAKPLDKALIRRHLRIQRKSVTASARATASRALVRQALRHHLIRKTRRIGLYIPSTSEIDVQPLIARALSMGAHCFLPIVPGRNRKKMWFSQIGEHPAWVLNRYGIPEYRHPLAKHVRAQALQILFIPLLGFDARGYRLGMGGGYYDASLAYRKHLKLWRRARVIGVAFSFQEVARLPEDDWDMPLDAVLTEREFRIFPSQRKSTRAISRL